MEATDALAAGFNMYWDRFSQIAATMLPAAIKVLVILLLSHFLLRLSRSLVKRLFFPERRLMTVDKQKAKTLESLLLSAFRYLIYFTAGVTILGTLGVKTDSLLASAGIAGIALGFGAQSLVRDILTGFFIIFENQFAVGDYVEAAGFSGFVEEIGLRTTKLRHFTGTVHVIPNGSIEKVTNHSRGNRTAIVEIAVPYGEDTERVEKIIRQALKEFGEESTALVEAPRLMGMSDLTPAAMVFRCAAKTRPMQHWAVARELRRTLKMALERQGIDPPYPRTVFSQERSRE